MSIPAAPQQLDPKSIQGLKYFSTLKDLLKRLHEVGTARDTAGNRNLFCDQYVGLLLLYYFNPTLTSLRGIQQASLLENVQKALGCQKTSLGSLNEAARVFDADCLKPILTELAPKLRPMALSSKSALSSNSREAELLAGLTAVDGTLLPALPKMFWALWNSRHDVRALVASLILSQIAWTFFLAGVGVRYTRHAQLFLHRLQLRGLLQRPQGVGAKQQGSSGNPGRSSSQT